MTLILHTQMSVLLASAASTGSDAGLEVWQIVLWSIVGIAMVWGVIWAALKLFFIALVLAAVVGGVCGAVYGGFSGGWQWVVGISGMAGGLLFAAYHTFSRSGGGGNNDEDEDGSETKGPFRWKGRRGAGSKKPLRPGPKPGADSEASDDQHNPS